MTAFQPLVVAGAVALVAGIATALAVRASAMFFERGTSRRWATVALSPSIIAASALVALLTPNPFAEVCHCAPHGHHHPHLCWIHPAYAGPLVTPALAVIAAWFVLRAPAIGRLAMSIVRSSRLARTLRSIPAVLIDGVAVHVLDCGEPTAFTAGFVRPRIVLDRALREELDARSLRAVVHHESAHVVRRDGLTLAALRLAEACFSVAALRSVVERWTSASELECDRHATRAVGSAFDVASALVAVERLRSSSRASPQEVAPAITSADLAQRVRALLAGGERPAHLASDALYLAFLAATILLLVAVWPGDAMHHLAETLLGAALHP